jgi:DNA-binding Xre family transcriptional regulator
VSGDNAGFAFPRRWLTVNPATAVIPFEGTCCDPAEPPGPLLGDNPMCKSCPMRIAIASESLRRELGRRGMTQAQLAASAGVSEATVSHAMVGRGIACTTLRKLAGALTVTATLPGADLLVPTHREAKVASTGRPQQSEGDG